MPPSVTASEWRIGCGVSRGSLRRWKSGSSPHGAAGESARRIVLRALARLLGREGVLEGSGVYRVREQEALQILAAERAQERRLRGRLHAFGDHFLTQAAGDA